MSEPTTLYDLRLESGLTLQEIITRMAKYTPKAPKEPTTIIQWEYRGCNRVPMLNALAKAMKMPVNQVIAASENSRVYGRPRPGKGRGKKVSRQ